VVSAAAAVRGLSFEPRQPPPRRCLCVTAEDKVVCAENRGQIERTSDALTPLMVVMFFTGLYKSLDSRHRLLGSKASEGKYTPSTGLFFDGSPIQAARLTRREWPSDISARTDAND